MWAQLVLTFNSCQFIFALYNQTARNSQNAKTGWSCQAMGGLKTISQNKSSHVSNSFARFWLMVWNLEICLWKGRFPRIPPGHQTTPPPTITWMWSRRCFLCVFIQATVKWLYGYTQEGPKKIFSFQNLDFESLLTKLNSTNLSLFQHQLWGKKSATFSVK